jgi:hypothetical protein
MKPITRTILAMALGSFLAHSASGAPSGDTSGAGAAPKVVTLRTPHGGNAPQAATGADGVVHVVYFKATAGSNGDLFYVRSRDGGATFSEPLRVNSQPGVAVSARHARLALGRGGRPHVAWNGNGVAQPRGPLNPAQPADSPYNGTPLLYTRLNDAGTAFEPQRNLMRHTYALDGGATVAADTEGNVYAIWHAMAEGLPQNEQGRRVWVARSNDDGKTFAEEALASDKPTGACGCCYVGAYAEGGGRLFVLFRAAESAMQRDMYLLASSDGGKSFRDARIDPWRTSTCPMSTAVLAPAREGLLAGWETEGRVVFGKAGGDASIGQRLPAPGDRPARRYPAIATNGRGETIHAWTEGMAWKRGGAAAWQVYSADGKPAGEPGRSDGVPADGTVAVFARADGTFVVMY